MIIELKADNIGPKREWSLEFAQRFNILTGDNGLGKTFVLDALWWGYANTWAASPFVPARGGDNLDVASSIQFYFDQVCTSAEYRYELATWDRRLTHLPDGLGVMVYARSDDCYLVMDPLRNQDAHLQIRPRPDDKVLPKPPAFRFNAHTILNGLNEDAKVLCNGLIRDWVTWQDRQSKAFDALATILEGLSPDPSSPLKPGPPTRFFGESRDIPTIITQNEIIPIIHVSSGIKKVLLLAYLLVWSWYEHVEAARLLNLKTGQKLVVMIDEVEAHLHPKWERIFLPALHRVIDQLVGEVQVQVLVTTHEPLVLASLETLFNDQKDKLFTFERVEQDIEITEAAYIKLGDTVSWLTSDVFGLKQARAKEAETVIEAAKAYMRGDYQELPAKLDTQDKIHHELLRVLASHDPFWPRWIVSRERVTSD